jgi:hypothetical protein
VKLKQIRRRHRLVKANVGSVGAAFGIPVSRLTRYGLASCALLALTAGNVLADDTAKPDPAKPDPTKQAAPTNDKKDAQAPAPAAPATPAAPAPGTVTYSGLVDFYLGINSRAPHPPQAILTPTGGHIYTDNTGLLFNINDRDPSLSQAELNISRTAGKGIPLGFTATLSFGDTASIVNANEPGGSGWQTIQQLYVTYTPRVLHRDITLDFGKWVTPFGNEVIESVNNDEYSHSFGFTYGIPLYHAGLRATVPITPKLTALGAIVNGWNDVADDNNAKSGIFQLTWKPDAKFTGILGYMGGQEGTGAYGAAVPVNKGYISTNLFEFVPQLQPGPNWKFAGDFIYGEGAGTINAASTHASDDWLGMAVYARFQATPRIGIATRLEQFEDSNGELRLAQPGYTKLDSLTLTFEYAIMKGKLVNRLEFRHDWANRDFYAAGGGFAQDQDTIYLSSVLKF